MPNFALIDPDGVVTNVIVVDDDDWLAAHVAETGLADAVDVTGQPVSPGDLYDGATFTTPPPPPDPPVE
jgi:hypothetical protein